MRLFKLEISGFKSFAKQTALEFPVAVSAIVGPNGSGKSNVAESIRWVMGEQSMKSLRGKRGEDLIFNGSPSVPRMGKASVSLHFDNADGAIPVDFPQVRIERRIFRDGSNEYLLNGSVVRLKDIVELMARMGLGDTKHNIIGQGEVDRWLLSSAKDRKEILEEALGLKVYQMKKIESERKLASTDENVRQVESLLRELAPHLKFLKSQAEKAEARGTIEAELKHLERVYFAKLLHEIETAETDIAKTATPIEAELAKAEARVQHIQSEIERKESHTAKPEDFAAIEAEIAKLETGRDELEREFGRLEGRVLLEREKLAKPLIRLADASYIKEKITHLLAALRPKSDDLERRIQTAITELESLIRDIDKGSVEVPADEGSRKELFALEVALGESEKRLRATKSALSTVREKMRVTDLAARSTEVELRKLERDLRQAEEARGGIRSQLERSSFERENLATRRDEFKKELSLAGIEALELREVKKEDVLSHGVPQELFKKIERLRGKLEEIGGIDIGVVKEYQETEARYAFLTKELEDLREAGTALQELIGTLEKQIADDFEKGFKKINEGFNEYFQIIFGGGKAKLSYQELGRRNKEDGDEGNVADGEDVEYGIDIEVDIPRKRIKSLSMLSGGERALTSIALLFAMVSVKPPPFLVLDETDAALDEANSQKYANTLAELSKKTQLIIITHNRETMMRAGVLYGVTMGDDGVSKLLSIKLEEGERYVNR